MSVSEYLKVTWELHQESPQIPSLHKACFNESGTQQNKLNSFRFPKAPRFPDSNPRHKKKATPGPGAYMREDRSNDRQEREKLNRKFKYFNKKRGFGLNPAFSLANQYYPKTPGPGAYNIK